MATGSRGSIGQSLLGFAILVLFVAWALNQAMRLVTAVWIQLVVVGTVVVTVGAAVLWVRSRRGGW